MSLTLEQNIHFGLGFGSLKDAFQSGRESAQMAKSQLPNGPADLVIVLGPDSPHFQDFIEGVRLITGEDQLIGMPVKRIFSTEATGNDLAYVLMFRSFTSPLSLTFTEVRDEKMNVTITSLLHQLRQIRGNMSFVEPHGGLLIIDRIGDDKTAAFVEKFSMELGFKSDLICLTPQEGLQNPFVVRSRGVGRGLIALEYLSPLRWGLGSVELKSFDKKSGIYAEGAKSAMRDALAQLKGHPPAAGLLFFNGNPEDAGEDPLDILNGAAALLPHIPVMGIPTSRQFLRSANRSAIAQPASIIGFLIPR